MIGCDTPLPPPSPPLSFSFSLSLSLSCFAPLHPISVTGFYFLKIHNRKTQGYFHNIHSNASLHTINKHARAASLSATLVICFLACLCPRPPPLSLSLSLPPSLSLLSLAVCLTCSYEC